MVAVPTERELVILEVLWNRREATVRQVYEELREGLPIVQNTVQAFLRTMDMKGLVEHRLDGRTFVYRPLVQRHAARSELASQLLTRVFEGSVDQLVRSIFAIRPPTAEELENLEALLGDQRRSFDRPSGEAARKTGLTGPDPLRPPPGGAIRIEDVWTSSKNLFVG